MWSVIAASAVSLPLIEEDSLAYRMNESDRLMSMRAVGLLIDRASLSGDHCPAA
jgi:hypothetical protein